MFALAAFQKSLDEYMRFYKEVWPHWSLAYKISTHFEEFDEKRHRII